MAYRMSVSLAGLGPTAAIGSTLPAAVAPAAIAPTAGPGPCSLAYGPVANVCQSSVPVTNIVPITTVTPIANTVAPQVAVGQPMAAAPWGKGVGAMGGIAPWGKGMGAMGAVAPWGKGMGAMGAGIPGISTMSKGTSPWGVGMQATTGFAPGVYGEGVGMPMIW